MVMVRVYRAEAPTQQRSALAPHEYSVELVLKESTVRVHRNQTFYSTQGGKPVTTLTRAAATTDFSVSGFITVSTNSQWRFDPFILQQIHV